MSMAESSSSPNPPRPDLRRRQRRLVFDRRYGWMCDFDEWTDPAVAALSGGRGMFCLLPMVKSLMSAAASSVDYAADSIRAALKRPDIFSPLAYQPHLQLDGKQQTWFHGLEQSGVVADTKLIPCRTT